MEFFAAYNRALATSKESENDYWTPNTTKNEEEEEGKKTMRRPTDDPLFLATEGARRSHRTRAGQTDS